MVTLTLTARGQVTFRKEILQHLGLKPGDKIDVNLLPGGQVTVQAPRRTGKIQDIFGLLAGKTDKVLTIDEINEVTADAWAGIR